MKKVILIITLILVCVILTGCTSIVVDTMGDHFKLIEQGEYTSLCYDTNTSAVYIVYNGPYRYGISPYIVFDGFGRATVGRWNGEKIVPGKWDGEYVIAER